MTHGYEKTPIKDIRKILTEKYNVVDQKTLDQTKIQLIYLLLELEKEDNIDFDGEEDDSMVDSDYEQTKSNMEKSGILVQPDMNSPEWYEYVMRQFTESELKDNHPTCDGCRRVVQKLIGPIIRSGIADYTSPSQDNLGTAIVVFQIEVLVENENHPLKGERIFYEDIADANKDNTDLPYRKHRTATAATRAEGRVLRKILRLQNTITAEEGSTKPNEEEDIDWTPDESITDTQIATIDCLCKRLDLSIIGFVNCGEKSYADIMIIPRTVAGRMIQLLNRIQQGTQEKPVGIKKYNPNWRNDDES